MKVKVEVGLKNFIKFEPNIWVCPYLTQIWVETTQDFFRVYRHDSYRLWASGSLL